MTIKQTSARILGGLLAATFLASTARAADVAAPPTVPAAVVAPRPFDVAFGVRLATDYNFRGISQSDRSFSPNAYVEFQFLDNLIYANVTAYRVDLPNRPAAEVDLAVGIRPKIGELSFDIGLIRYMYPRGRPLFDPFGALLVPGNTDYTEIAGRVSWTWQDRLTLGAGLFHSADWLATGARGTYGNVTARLVIPQSIGSGTLAASGEFGHYWFGITSPELGSVRLPNYFYWNLGLSYSVGPVTLDARYHDTNLSRSQCFTLTGDPAGIPTGRSAWCGAAVIGTVSIDLTASGLGLFGAR